MRDYYSNIRHPSPNTSKINNPLGKRTSRISLPFVTILSNHKGYRVRTSATGSVLRPCKPVKAELL